MRRSNKIHNADLFTSAANASFQKHLKTQSKKALELINARIDWVKLLRPLEAKLAKERHTLSAAGRPAHDLLLIVKCFLLQAMYDLSDPRLEEEIADRRSFQIFLELNSHDAIPDETSICRYREIFSRLELDRLLFSGFNRQLAQLGMIIGKGTIVDATLKQAQAHGGGGRDKDAQYAGRKGKAFFGYKGHIGMDQKTDIVHSALFTTANIPDTTHFEDLLLGTEKRAYADKGYTSRKRRKALEDKGIFCGVMFRAKRGHPLTRRQRKRNAGYARVRAAVERPFAYLGRILHYTRCRYYDIRRNRFQFLISLWTYNIRRSLSLSLVRIR
jgi:transposase, IS5 family